MGHSPGRDEVGEHGIRVSGEDISILYVYVYVYVYVCVCVCCFELRYFSVLKIKFMRYRKKNLSVEKKNEVFFFVFLLLCFWSFCS